jgi:hypothetical protein
MFKMNYLLLSTIICIFFSAYMMAQNVATTIAEMYPDEEIKILNERNPEKNSEGSWVQGSSMPHARYYAGSVMYTRNDTSWLYVFGGDTTGNGDPTKACLRYNVNTDTWEYIAPLPEPMRVNAAARLGDKLYTMGGFNAPFPATSISSFYEYDVNTNTWTQLPDLPIPMFFIGAEGYQDSIIYIIGGFTDTSTTEHSRLAVALDDVRAYNRDAVSIRDATPLIHASANSGYVIQGGLLVAIGGLQNPTELIETTQRGEINISDRAQINWSLGANYPFKVHAHYVYGVSLDELYTAGGSKVPGFEPGDDSFSYKLNTNQYNREQDLPLNLMAFSGGVNYDFSNDDDPEILKIVIAGGITTGPALTAQTWVYVDTMTVGVETVNNNIPEEYVLKQNYPNPFNPRTTIQFSIPAEGFVTLYVFNALGETVSTLVSENLNAGTYKYDWNAVELPSGIYFYRLNANEYTVSKKMILLK